MVCASTPFGLIKMKLIILSSCALFLQVTHINTDTKATHSCITLLREIKVMLPIRGFDSALLVTGPPLTSAAVTAVGLTELHHGTGNVRDSFLLPATLTIPEMSSLVLLHPHPPTFPSFLLNYAVNMRVSLPCKLMCLICNTFTTV